VPRRARLGLRLRGVDDMTRLVRYDTRRYPTCTKCHKVFMTKAAAIAHGLLPGHKVT
jgi:hypothetical protein